MYGINSSDQSTEGLREQAEKLVNAFAHDLAEGLRRVADKRRNDAKNRYQVSEIFKAEGMDTAANLIDPESW